MDGLQTAPEMVHRIRAAALVVSDDHVLLVEHTHLRTGALFWVPPGGGLKGSESIFDCARREAWEETNLTIEPGRVVYVRQFIEHPANCHHLELFVLCWAFHGDVHIDNVIGEPDEPYIRQARFLSRAELQTRTVYPEMLKDQFWHDLAEGFPETRYLGVSVE